jgi:hypothetical protein
MARKYVNPNRPTDDAAVLAAAAGILRRRTPVGREQQFESARVLLLALAIKIRSETAKPAAAKEPA